MSDDKDKKPEDPPKEGEEAEENPAPDDDGDSEESQDGEEDIKPTGLVAKLRNNLKLILAGLGGVAIIGLVGALYFTSLGEKVSDSLSATPKAKMALPELSVFQDLPLITVDLLPTPKRKRPFIRLLVTVEVTGEAGRAKLIDEEARILNAIQLFLRTQTVEDLSGQAGSEKLRDKIISAINPVIVPEKALSVLFKEILVR